MDILLEDGTPYEFLVTQGHLYTYAATRISAGATFNIEFFDGEATGTEDNIATTSNEPDGVWVPIDDTSNGADAYSAGTFVSPYTGVRAVVTGGTAKFKLKRAYID